MASLYIVLARGSIRLTREPDTLAIDPVWSSEQCGCSTKMSALVICLHLIATSEGKETRTPR